MPGASDPPLISVIMPVWNGAAFLDRAIRSLLAQIFTRWELLAVDDGSTDDSYALLCRAAEADPRIRAFQLPANRGIAVARNHALAQARGLLIAYLDCDDEFFPDHFEHVAVCHDKAEVLVFAYDLVEERPGLRETTPVRTWIPAVVRQHLHQVNIVVPMGVVHRRDLLDRVGLFDETLREEEDWDLWKRMANTGSTFYFVPARCGRYHVRADSTARNYHPRQNPGS